VSGSGIYIKSGGQLRPAATLPGPPGVNGDSAYLIAVANGFVGTQVQWLASLHGTNGTNGTSGDLGAAARLYMYSNLI